MTTEQEPGAADRNAETEHRSTTTLLGDLLHQVSDLFRKEIQLLRAELSEKVNDSVTAVGMIVAGLVLGLVAANALVAALIAALAELGLDAGWAAVIVGAALAIIGYGLVSSGLKSLKASRLAPDRTARSLRQDATVVKDRVK